MRTLTGTCAMVNYLIFHFKLLMNIPYVRDQTFISFLSKYMQHSVSLLLKRYKLYVCNSGELNNEKIACLIMRLCNPVFLYVNQRSVCNTHYDLQRFTDLHWVTQPCTCRVTLHQKPTQALNNSQHIQINLHHWFCRYHS